MTAPGNTDPLAIVDNSGAITKKITRQNLLKGTPLPADTVDAQSIANDSVTTNKIANNGVTAAKLATNAIKLGKASISSGITTTSTVAVQATGLSSSVTIPAGGRSIKITVVLPSVQGSAISNIFITIWDGTVGSGTQLQLSQFTCGGADYRIPQTVIAEATPAAGSKTYNVGFHNSNGTTTTLAASATANAFILVEAI